MNSASDGDEQRGQATTCHVCGSGDLTVLGDQVGLKGVTSDCKPWPRSMALAACHVCGLIQKPSSPEWLATIAEVYNAYAIYHQSPGAEQAVFDSASGQSAPRSQRLLSRMLTECQLPSAGRLLDIGCGNGVLLRTFSSLAPGWTLAGADLDDRHRETVLGIPGVDRFYAGPAEEIGDQFDVITMQHVLEHVPEPVDLLSRLGRLLNPGGLLFIQVPNILDNPFDLMVVDHSSHFSPETVRTTVRRAGLRPVVLATDWAPKELTVAAGAGSDAAPLDGSDTDAAASADALVVRLNWLSAVAADARQAARDGSLGVLGTSIAGTWIGNTLDGAAQFFVDEDAGRIGRQFMDRPVIHPSSVPAGATVYVGFPPAQAHDIARRLTERYPNVRWHVPPDQTW